MTGREILEALNGVMANINRSGGPADKLRRKNNAAKVGALVDRICPKRRATVEERAIANRGFLCSADAELYSGMVPDMDAELDPRKVAIGMYNFVNSMKG